MGPPILLDENLEHEILHRLRKYGHEAEHIDFHDSLQKGDEDGTLANYSLENGVFLVTYDDGFATHYDESDYWGVLLWTDNDWSATDIADTVHRILTLYSPPALQQIKTGRQAGPADG